MATTVRWLPLPPTPANTTTRFVPSPTPTSAASPPRPLVGARSRRLAAAAASPRAFRRAEFDAFVQRVASGQALRDAWRGANDGAEWLAFEARRAARRLEERLELSRRLGEAARVASARARELDVELGIGRRWRSFSVDFSRNWPRYRENLNDFTRTPIGRGFTTLFFLWFALSGWLFRIAFWGVLILPFAAPLLLARFGMDSAVIAGTCPACNTRFTGFRKQVIRCTNCQNIVWQPTSAYAERGRSSRNSEPDIIDVEYEEK